MRTADTLKATPKVTIVLDNSDHAKEFDYANLVHQSEFEAIIKFISKALKLAEKDMGSDANHKHNTITLLGSRGSGKTSFLLSIANWIKDNEKKDKGIDIDPSSIQVLDIIDPTLIEEKGHVFLNIISMIADLVERKLAKDECSSRNESMPVISRKEWRSSLNKLAAGLPSIDGIGSHYGDSWQDAEFVMDNGLKAVAASQKLSNNFNDFLKKSLDIIGRKAFVLIFDDIDVDTSKGWVVLETIRKYFTGPRLITIISGDLELYTTVVRQNKWQNFGAEILKYEGIHAGTPDGLNEKRKLVTKLTAQYMLKIMQPQYRIHLSSLLSKIIDEKLDIEVVLRQTEKTINLESLYVEILSEYGIRNKVQVEVFTTFMLSQPLRSQIQFLLLVKYADNKLAPFKNAEITAVFLSDLLEQKIEVAVGENTAKYLIAVVLKFLLSKRYLDGLYQLLPTTTDDSLNASLFSLNLLLSNTIKNNYRFLIFEYLIKVGYLRNLVPILPYRDDNVLDDKLKPNLDDLCDRAGLLNDGILRNVTGKIQAYLYSTLELDGAVSDITPHFIQLKALKYRANKPFKDRIDGVFSQPKVSNAERILGYMPCFSSTYGYKNESRIGYSFYLLLASIGEIVKEYETVYFDPENYKVDLLKLLLTELSQLRSYPMVGFVRRQVDLSQGNVIEPVRNLKGKSEDNSDTLLAEAILKWLKSNRTIAVASHLLGKTITRFFYAMSSIAETGARNLTLDVLFHRQTVAFMNAVLIEDARENLKEISTDLNINNTRTEDSIFVSNLRTIITIKETSEFEKLKFSRWILACPLLLPFLTITKGGELESALNEFLSNEESREKAVLYTTGLSMAHLLADVAIRSHQSIDDEGSFKTVQGSIALLDNPDQLVEILKSNNIPYEWFATTDSVTNRRGYNTLIERYISSVFPRSPRNGARITKFRKYLAENNIKW
ncbi:P-loop NTPase fold protein [Chitinophaga sp. 22536]|uniref:P-loop NTPase fold protein n=1 Tax=unclassified Chitinophaga TaxID=2619133 RepID=UPI003F87957E